MKASFNISVKYILSAVLFVLALGYTKAQSTSFTTNAPNAVVKGAQFRLTYTLSNADGTNFRPNSDNINGFNVLYGPSVSSSSSIQIINGKQSSNSTVSYIYTLEAAKEGTFTLPGATIQVDGKTLTSKSVQVKVLPPDKNANQNQANSNNRQSNQNGGGPFPTNSNSNNISSSDAFIRAIVSKTKVYDQEAFTVTFRFYTTLDVRDIGNVEFPEFNGFMVEDQDLPGNKQLQLDHYNGRNYYAVDLKRSLLFPQKTGEISIPSGKIEMVFSVPSSRVVNTIMGPQYIMSDVKKTLVTNPIKIDVMPLPQGKPSSFANAVGTFSLTPSISATKVKANEAITLTLDISGTGNLKLIKTPEITLPKDFEEFDPKITNNFKFSTKGLSGNKKIEYLFIPRYPGNFKISPIDISYFDIDSNTYKTLSTPEYEITVGKDPNAGNTSVVSNYAQSDVKVENDIRYLKTGNPSVSFINSYFAGSLSYYLWYIIPALLFLIALILYRKQIKENADLVALKTKRANKVAIKRLKQAAKYLSANQKEAFYEEVLRANWGYLSDKLIIPVSELSRDNIEQELNRYGASSTLISKFINVLDTCEFAQYAPVESDAAMDNLYKDAVDAIGEMESTKNKKG